jgi:hypothetical protein
MASLVCLDVVHVARAHTVVADGVTAEWSTRDASTSSTANVGIIVRDVGLTGEYVFIDAQGDVRTDLGSASEQDIVRFAVTADADSLSFLIRSAGPDFNVVPQVQISLDVDRVFGSGQAFLAGLSDTRVSERARWEYLIQTRFSVGQQARVLDQQFVEIAAVPAERSATGEIEIDVPWEALGLGGPPDGAIRITVATFQSDSNGNEDTVDLGGPFSSNAFDAIGDCGDPRVTNFPNAWDCDLSDGIIDFAVDVWFEGDGDVISPLLVTHFVVNSSSPEPGREWVGVTNVTTQPITLDSFKLGDEETIDATGESMRVLSGIDVAPGGTFVLAVDAVAYQGLYGEPPDFEVLSDTTAVDAPAYPAWTSTLTWSGLANSSDHILLLDDVNTILDVVNYASLLGGGAYTGVAPFYDGLPFTEDEVLLRVPAMQDTDDNSVDFVRGTSCADDASCAGGVFCNNCIVNTCTPEPTGTPCPDGNVCNGDETCDGLGACTAGTNLDCDDGNPCTADSCGLTAGCEHTFLPASTPCDDATLCNGSETCDGAGACLPGAPPDCEDANPCTADSCDPADGCQYDFEAAGTPCDDATACNGNETCDDAGVCQPGTPPNCDDQNVCTSDSCDAALGCVHVDAPDNTPCPDSTVCNGAETCQGGACTPGTPPACSDTNPCTDNSCDPVDGCEVTNSAPNTPCPDGDACNGAETCDGAGACQPGTPLVCTDTNPCTDNSCDPVDGCEVTNSAPNTPCPDGNACNGAEACDGAGVCQPGTPPDCDDENPCTIDTCDALAGCDNEAVPPGTDCPDGDLCNGDEECDAMTTCVAGTPLVCEDSNVCTVDTCDAELGCAFTATPGESCDGDGDPCNGTATCNSAGNCIPGDPPVDGGICDLDAGIDAGSADAGLADAAVIDATPSDAAVIDVALHDVSVPSIDAGADAFVAPGSDAAGAEDDDSYYTCQCRVGTRSASRLPWLGLVGAAALLLTLRRRKQ